MASALEETALSRSVTVFQNRRTNSQRRPDDSRKSSVRHDRVTIGVDIEASHLASLDEEAVPLEASHPRFQRFVRFALGTGARLDEIRGIDPDRDIHWQDGTVHVIGKFPKERGIPM